MNKTVVYLEKKLECPLFYKEKFVRKCFVRRNEKQDRGMH